MSVILGRKQQVVRTITNRPSNTSLTMRDFRETPCLYQTLHSKVTSVDISMVVRLWPAALGLVSKSLGVNRSIGMADQAHVA